MSGTPTRAEQPPWRPLKIALACDWFTPRVGGIELHLRELARRLAIAGHDVQVITPTRGPATESGVPVHRLCVPLFPYFDFMWTPAGFAALDRVIATQRFDVLHAHASIVSPTAFGAALLALRHDTPVVLTFHSVLRNHARWLSAASRLMRLGQRAVTYTAVSAVVALEASALLGGRAVTVLPNGVDPGDWAPRRSATRARRPVNVVRLASVMRITPKKRPRALVRIMGQLLAALPAGITAELQIAGDGPELPALHRLVNDSGLAHAIHFLGRLPRDQIRALYASSDVFVLPTTLESFGIAALEARCAGLPVVVRREAGIASFLTDGSDSLLARSDDEMVAQLRRLTIDAHLRERIAAHNRTAPPPAGCAWPEVLDGHLATYRSAIGYAHPFGT